MRLAVILVISFVTASCTTVSPQVCAEGEQQMVYRILHDGDLEYVSEPIDQTCVGGQWTAEGDRPTVSHEGPAEDPEQHLYYR